MESSLTLISPVAWALLLVPLLVISVLVFSHARHGALPQSGHTRLSARDRKELKGFRQQAIAALYGIRRKVDLVEAEDLFRQAYARGDCLAGMWIWDMLVYKPGNQAKQEAGKILEDCAGIVEGLARRGDPEAEFLYCISPLGMQTDHERYMKMKMLEHSCASGFMPAWILLGKLEYRQFHNPAVAMKWYRQAAEHGSAIAFAGCALLLCDEDYSGYNPSEGQAMLEQGVEAGDPVAMLWLARYFLNGNFGEPQPKLARQYLEDAARLGECRAMIDLARLHLDGLAGPVDNAEARRLLDQAKEYNRGTKITDLISQLETRLKGESS
ncbi:MAG: tetratricopeptide repeat protein [bacterium]